MRALAAVAVAAVSFHPLEAAACGCFASNTTTTTPVVQAGERILFVSEGNHVTAYVQIQFKGDAADFGWLVPLPAVPTVKAGVDELFEVLDKSTNPTFSLTTTTNPECRPKFSFGCGGAALSAPTGGGGGAGVGGNPLVLRDTTGPYEYAVLKADSKSELLTWLSDNRFVVPTTSDAALMPYIRPGGYFLALKLRAGQMTGDLRPVVLDYTSDYPMVPLILTSATAVPHMGVLVYVLGSKRAIPRNYSHVELNLLKLDWATGKNYPDLVTEAIGEAPDKHAFITEYAGTSTVVPVGALAPLGRFGDRSTLANQPTATDFVEYLFQHGFTKGDETGDLIEAVLSALGTQIPVPPAFASHGITAQQFYQSARQFLDTNYQQANPDLYAGWAGVSFNATTLSDTVWNDVAQPYVDAQTALDTHTYLTRLFTSISPEDMTADPVFAFNGTLSDVPLQRTASRVSGCMGVDTTFTASGYTVQDESKLTTAKKDEMPAAARVETLAEEGPPTVVNEYQLDIGGMGNKCAIADGAFMVGLGALWLLIRRRRIS